MGYKARKCRVCGRMFVPREAKELFCPGICSQTGSFLSGAGDTSKPSTEYKAANPRKGRDGGCGRSAEKKPVKAGRGLAERYPRVVAMFALPVEERGKISSTFTAEEAEYARRVAKRMLVEEREMEMSCSWEGEYDGGEVFERGSGLRDIRIGDSDDGTV